MKKDIAWHMNCFKNVKLYIGRKKNDIEREQKELDRAITANNLYEAQISLAKKKRKDGFDRDRFGLKELLG